MMRKLGIALSNFGSPKSRVRCFAHVVNLVAKSFLKLFDCKRNNKNRKRKGKKKADKPDESAQETGKEDSEDEGEDKATRQKHQAADTKVDLEELVAKLDDIERGGKLEDTDDPADLFDEYSDMTEERKAQFLAETKAVSTSLQKVCASLSHAVIGVAKCPMFGC